MKKDQDKLTFWGGVFLGAWVAAMVSAFIADSHGDRYWKERIVAHRGAYLQTYGDDHVMFVWNDR